MVLHFGGEKEEDDVKRLERRRSRRNTARENSEGDGKGEKKEDIRQFWIELGRR